MSRALNVVDCETDVSVGVVGFGKTLNNRWTSIIVAIM